MIGTKGNSKTYFAPRLWVHRRLQGQRQHRGFFRTAHRVAFLLDWRDWRVDGLLQVINAQCILHGGKVDGLVDGAVVIQLDGVRVQRGEIQSTCRIMNKVKNKLIIPSLRQKGGK